MSKQREAGELKLKNRVKRLARLVEINAPVIVMATEAQMIMDALWLMDADAVGMSLARREGERVSKAAGFVDEEFVFTCKDGVATKHIDINGPMCGDEGEEHGDHDLDEEVECAICFYKERA